MTAGRWILLACNLPPALLVGWPIGGLLLLFRRAHTPRWEDGVLTMTRRKGATKSLTLPRCVAYTEEGRASLRVKRHEQGAHVPQGEDLSFGGAIMLGPIHGGSAAGLLALLGLVTPIVWWVPPAVGAVVWSVTWCVAPLHLVAEYISAPLRYGVAGGIGSWLARWYRTGARMSQHERSAYAQSDDSAAWERAERQHRGQP